MLDFAKHFHMTGIIHVFFHAPTFLERFKDSHVTFSILLPSFRMTKACHHTSLENKKNAPPLASAPGWRRKLFKNTTALKADYDSAIHLKTALFGTHSQPPTRVHGKHSRLLPCIAVPIFCSLNLPHTHPPPPHSQRLLAVSKLP